MATASSKVALLAIDRAPASDIADPKTFQKIFWLTGTPKKKKKKNQKTTRLVRRRRKSKREEEKTTLSTVTISKTPERKNNTVM
jgi:hypothetical protein